MKKTRTSTSYLALLPAAGFLTAVLGFAVCRLLALSFETLQPGGPGSFAGLRNFERLAGDGRWWAALATTGVFTGASVLLEGILGIALALLLHVPMRLRGLVRAGVLLPWALPSAVMALAWAWMFHDTFGVVNDLLRRAGILDASFAWLGHPRTAMAVLVLADVWKTTPFVALIVLAGLQGIPGEILEAARLDGLGSWARLRRILLPLAAPSLLAALLFRAVQALGAFDLIYVMTGGGPGGSTETVALYAYRTFFRHLDFGYGAAQVVAVAGIAAAGGGLCAAGLRRMRAAARWGTSVPRPPWREAPEKLPQGGWR